MTKTVQPATKSVEIFSGLLLAVLPVLGLTLGLRNAFFSGFYVAAAFWASALFFKMAHSFFPPKCLKFSWVLCIASLTQVGRYVAGVSPLAGLSLLCLSWPCLEEPEQKFSDIFWRGFGFWMLLSFLGSAQEILAGHLSIKIFNQPSGTLLLLTLAVFLFQPRKRPLRG